jgi:hypothetical protein
MNTVVERFFIILGVVCFCGFMFGQPLALANHPFENGIDRVDQALRAGRIDLKTAVLQRAKILFAPQRAALEGEDIGDETPRLELFEDVRRVFEKLTGEEKDYLRSLSPELARVIDEAEHGGEVQGTPAFERLPNTFDRVSKAQDLKEISLKEAVLLKARLLFAPHTIGTKHPFSVQAGEVPVQEKCLTGFYKDVHRVFDQLTYEEISFLGSLSPDLEVILATREQERAGMVGPSRTSALPSYPDLDQQEEGKNCIVHYTLTGANAAPDKTYAELVRLYMDKAIKSDMPKNFTKAFAEGYPDFKGKLHVYLMDIGAGGEWVDVSMVGGMARAGYVKLGTKLKDRYPDSWQLLMKGESFHEYFHGIQSAYNWASDLWFLEATSTWAMCYYANDFMHVKQDHYDDGDSVFKTPNGFLWSTAGSRKYSASALVFYFTDKFNGHQIIKSYFINSILEGDAIKNLQQILIAKGTTFSEEYTCFLASLFSKKITSIKKYMPDVNIATTHNTYGLDKTTGNVFLTGANFHVFDPEAGVQPASFIATFTAGTTGVPKGVLVKQKSKIPIAFLPHISGSPTAYVGDFGGDVKQVVLIVTDTDYSTKDTAPRSYEYTAIVPRVIVKDVTAESPIYSGESSQIDIKYDLLGTYPGKPFPVQMKITEKGPDVADNASGELVLPSGVDQILNLWFNTGWNTVGNYRFTFQLAVPADSWLPIPQVKSKGKCSVVVEEPPEGATARQVEAVREIKRPVLTIKK